MGRETSIQDFTLHIQFFERFRLTGGEVVLDADGIRSEMVTKLLAYLICHRKKTMSVQELSDVLWPEEGSDNPAGALKNLMYRLRGILKKTWGDREYVLTGRGSYQWNPEISMIVDAEKFDEYCRQMENAKDNKEKIKWGTEAADLYKGMFLPELSGEYWVISLSTYYHSLYLSTVKETADLLEQEKRYPVIEQICQSAIRLDPLDEEIHCHLIKAMIADNKQNLAMSHYRDTVKLLYDSLGVRPSREFQAVYEELLKQQHEHEQDISVIQEELQEENLPRGAFLCEYGVFRKMYSLEARSSGRLGISVHLALLTLYPTYNIDRSDEVYQKLMNRGMKLLEDVLISSLRSSDIICRYSGNQYLIMLPACQYESAVMVMGRIQDHFYAADRKIKVRIQYSLDEIDVA